MDNTQKFLHGRDYQKAKDYLIEMGVYERVVSTSPVGERDFVIIIAANVEYEKRNKQVND